MKPMRTFLLSVVVAALLAACGATAADGGDPVDPAEADATVTAVDLAFDPGVVTVTVAAGEGFTLALVNEDSMPHNIAIYADASKSEKLFEGDVVTDGTIVYEVEALAAGEYFFDCSLHPNMTGTLIIES
jgi:plastocyanin